jgi:hypothetical protein
MKRFLGLLALVVLTAAATSGSIQYSAINPITGALKYASGVFSQAGAGDLTNGTTGSGALVLSIGPTTVGINDTGGIQSTGLFNFNGSAYTDIGGLAKIEYLANPPPVTLDINTYPGGAIGYLSVLSTSNTSTAGVVGIMSIVTNNVTEANGGGFGEAGWFSAYAGAVGASSIVGLYAQGTSETGNVSSGEVNALDAFIACNRTYAFGTSSCNGIEISSISATQADNAIYVQNANGTKTFPAFGTVLAINTTSGNVANVYIGDIGTSTVTAAYGTQYTKTTFSTLEYQGPSFQIGPTVTNFNAVLQANGTASGAPSLSVVGAGGSPATNANLNLAPLGTGVLAVGGTAGVSCGAGTVSLTTLVVTKGLVTHC